MEKIINLKNNNINIMIDLEGGSITNIIMDNEEKLHQNETGCWPDKKRKPNAKNQPAPILFPVCGPLEKKQKDISGYNISNTFYEMKQHGFARNELFKLIKKSETECTIELTSNENIKKQYPYKFRLRINYKLTPNGIIIKYEVKNIDNQNIYFNIGDHPGFRLNKNINNYMLKLNSQKNISLKFKDNNNNLITKKINNGIIKLNSELCQNRRVITVDTKQPKSITLFENDIPILRYQIKSDSLRLWSADYETFICIEPWYGDNNLFKNAKENIQNGSIKSLKPKDSFTYKRKISFYNQNILKHIFPLENEKTKIKKI